ncbi:MAG: hypothetical protein K0R38_2020 [Polyangiaceae bacterium]|nr:hypothetical protein [Polyangiaceae bacterium]
MRDDQGLAGEREARKSRSAAAPATCHGICECRGVDFTDRRDERVPNAIWIGRDCHRERSEPLVHDSNSELGGVTLMNLAVEHSVERHLRCGEVAILVVEM